MVAHAPTATPNRKRRSICTSTRRALLLHTQSKAALHLHQYAQSTLQMVRLVYAWAATVAAALQRAPRPRFGSRRSAAAASDDADWFAPSHRAACPSDMWSLEGEGICKYFLAGVKTWDGTSVFTDCDAG